MNDFAGAILQFLEAGPATTEQVLEHIEESSGEPLEAGLSQQIRGLIEKFDESGLIEPNRPSKLGALEDR